MSGGEWRSLGPAVAAHRGAPFVRCGGGVAEIQDQLSLRMCGAPFRWCGWWVAGSGPAVAAHRGAPFVRCGGGVAEIQDQLSLRMCGAPFRWCGWWVAGFRTSCRYASRALLSGGSNRRWRIPDRLSLLFGGTPSVAGSLWVRTSCRCAWSPGHAGPAEGRSRSWPARSVTLLAGHATLLSRLPGLDRCPDQPIAGRQM